MKEGTLVRLVVSEQDDSLDYEELKAQADEHGYIYIILEECPEGYYGVNCEGENTRYVPNGVNRLWRTRSIATGADDCPLWDGEFEIVEE